jgi:hypothetical protein
MDDGGFRTLVKRGLRHFYDNISLHLPFQGTVKKNSVLVPKKRLFEDLIPEKMVESNNKNYEKGIINGLEKLVEKNDKVTILGGGLGVTAVKAAKITGEPSKVTVYEGSKSQILKMKETFRRNNLPAINIKHAVVGSEKNVWGSSKEAESISVKELEKCDVLEMDVEGSELEILKDLDIRPRAIIVESHGFMGSSTENVKDSLEELGYDIYNVELAEDTEHAKENDIKVVTGVKN